MAFGSTEIKCNLGMERKYSECLHLVLQIIMIFLQLSWSITFCDSIEMSFKNSILNNAILSWLAFIVKMKLMTKWQLFPFVSFHFAIFHEQINVCHSEGICTLINSKIHKWIHLIVNNFQARLLDLFMRAFCQNQDHKWLEKRNTSMNYSTINSWICLAYHNLILKLMKLLIRPIGCLSTPQKTHKVKLNYK